MGSALNRFLISIAAVVVCGCSASPPPLVLSSDDVAVTLRGDGNLDVVESIAATFAAGSVFERTVPRGRYDAIAFVDTTVDARVVPRSSSSPAGVRVDVADGRALRVRWILTAPASAIQLRYRVSGALALEGRQRRLEWRSIAAGRQDMIQRATLSLQPPAGVPLLVPSGIAEAGWRVEIEGGRLTADRADLMPDETATVLALLGGGDLPVREPAWQFDAARIGQLAPAFLAGGAFILVVAIGIVVMAWWHGRRAAAAQLRTGSIVVLVSGIVTMVLTELLLPRLGWWPQSIGVSLIAGAALFFLASLRVR